MAWEDRIREAAYTSPGGTRTVFQYENVRETVEKKTTAFEFPDANGTYVQDLGHSGRRYPLRVFFWGADYDIEAAAFIEGLLESGIGRLEHPVYGALDVVPFGSITRRDDLKTAANQAVIQVTFWETIDILYPAVQDDPAAGVLGAVRGYNAAAAEQFDESAGLDNTVSKATLKGQYEALLASTSTALQSIADVQDDVRQQFDAIVDSINAGIDTLISDPISLAFQTTLMIQAPARAAAAVQDRLSAYSDLIESIISGDGAVVSSGGNPLVANEFYVRDLYVSTYVTGDVVSVVNNQFETKTDALGVADALLSQLDDVVSWRDANYAALGVVDTGEAYQKLQEAVALAAGFLVEISFTLKQERRLVLTRDRTIIDLTAELYGSVDDNLDFFINSNGLTGSEILTVPRGREVVFYV